MKHFKFRVYYEYNGPSYSDPFRTRKTDQEIRDVLKEFPSSLSHYFNSEQVTIQPDEPQLDQNSSYVSLSTEIDGNEVFKNVSLCLNSLDLFGEIISKPTL